MNICTPIKKHEQNKCPKYDYCESRVNEFLEKIDDSMFFRDSSSTYDTDSFIKFIDSLKGEIEISFRVDEQDFKSSRRNFYVNPWITPGIIASITKKHLYYRLWKKTQTKNNLDGDNAFYIRFKGYRKYLKKVIKLAKKNFYCKKFNSVQGDLKKTWGLINELRGKVRQSIKASFVIDGELVEDRRKISNEFNNFFASVAKKLNVKTCSSTLNGGSSSNDFRLYLNNRVQKSIFLSPTSPNELIEIVSNLENDKASDISIFILKKCFKYIAGHLSGFFNKFMETGKFPEILKIGKITPIFIKGDPQLLDNYRPVSVILPILERLNSSIVMIKRIIKFIPKSEYIKIYDALFQSHLSYCISSWGGIPSSKLHGLFAIQKRFIQLLFGTEYSFDHAGYYETCARARSYTDHISTKNHCLEQTKPLFNKHNLLTLSNFYVYIPYIFRIIQNFKNSCSYIIIFSIYPEPKGQ